MIFVRCYRVMNTGSHKQGIESAGFAPFLIREMRWSNDFDFGFDKYDPKSWKNFLQNYVTKDGKKLPRKSQMGMKLAYNVYQYGGPHFHPRVGKMAGSYCNLFPGYDGDGRALKVSQFGMLE